MSLILEALKKLDREKQAPERGVVVLGATAWAARREGPSRFLAYVLVDLALLAIGATVAMWWLAPAAPPAAAPRVAPSVAPRGAGALAVAPLAFPSPAVAPRRAPEPAARTPVRPTRSATPTPRPEPTAEPPFVLQAVTEQDGIPVALINQRVVRVGDGFDGMRVLRIGATEVEIEIEATGAHELLTF